MNVKAAKNKVFLYRNFVYKNTEKGKKLLPAALEIDSISIVTINPANVKESIRRVFNYCRYLIVYWKIANHR
ncbi:MAG TPA: hypothetical protein VK469_04645 [Candidatus Kapabacteria bacterium]|nr:hypothetical protein [Candidatus Kapabacteria bacterium]